MVRPKTAKITNFTRLITSLYCSFLSNDSFCKKKGHGSRAPIKIRKGSCPAWDKECGNCGKLGHFKEVCRSKKKNEAGALKAVEGNEVDASRDTEGGVLGSISNSVNFCKLLIVADVSLPENKSKVRPEEAEKELPNKN